MNLLELVDDATDAAVQAIAETVQRAMQVDGDVAGHFFDGTRDYRETIRELVWAYVMLEKLNMDGGTE